MTETTQGGAVATTKPAVASGTGSSGSSTSYGTPYYPRTDVEYGLMWNDGQVTRTYGTGASGGVKDAIKWFMNSIKLRRIGVYTKNFYATGIVTRQVVKKASSSADWEEGAWTKYELSREDMLDLYKAG